jgi:hypothetical protein
MTAADDEARREAATKMEAALAQARADLDASKEAAARLAETTARLPALRPAERTS